MKLISTKEQNPLLKQAFSVRINRRTCETFGCLQVGEHYGMIQAHCRRCGHWNYCSTDKDWTLPWNEYEPTKNQIASKPIK